MEPLCQCPHCGAALDRRRLKPPRQVKRQPRVSQPPSKPNGRSKMWMSMRMLRRFSAQDIAATAECGLKSARNYITALIEADYLRVAHVSSGEVGDYSTYQLLTDSGPHAPRLRADGQSLLDLNLDKEVPRVRRAA